MFDRFVRFTYKSINSQICNRPIRVSNIGFCMFKTFARILNVLLMKNSFDVELRDTGMA